MPPKNSLLYVEDRLGRVEEDVSSLQDDVGELKTSQARSEANYENLTKAVDTLSDKIDSGFDKMSTALVEHDKALTRIHDDKLKWQKRKGWMLGVAASALTLVGKYIYTLLTGVFLR